MHSADNEALRQRVVRAAESALASQNFVSPIDVLSRMGLLAPTHVAAWRQGRIDSLEQVIQGNPKKISFSIAEFRRWAESSGLQPSEAAYVLRTRTGTRDLRFSTNGDASIEKIYRTHFVSAKLSEQRRKNLETRFSQPSQNVVFQIINDSQCSECGAELSKNSLLLMEAGQPLCLPCARLGDLEYLPAGDAALTRRATKHSGRSAVVVRFSKSRGRYERQGILVEEQALQKAEQECMADAGQRAAARARDAERRRQDDLELVVRMTERLSVLFPRCPPQEIHAIAQHTAVRNTGRIGRTAAGRDLEQGALTAAVIAAIRHTHTNYDVLLADGMERSLAREEVADRVQKILASWRA